jgi:hypothetical protein
MTDQHDRDAARDLDRRLAGFLGEDRGRAPERAIEGALLHARSHPRRRDALAAVRPDPMDGWAAAFGLGRASTGLGRTMPRLAMVAALGLLLVAAFAVASVGGVFERPALVPVPSPAPSAPVTPSPTPTAPAIETIRVDLTERYGADAFIEVTDESGTVTSAMSGTPADGGSTDGEQVAVTDGPSPETVVLTWTGLPCEIGHQLLIQPDGRSMTLFRTTCDGDTIPRDLVLELTFDAPVSPADLDVMLETTEP